MSIEVIGALLGLLVVVFLFSRIWFHLVEGVLGFCKRLIFRRKEPPAWHPLQEDSGDSNDL